MIKEKPHFDNYSNNELLKLSNNLTLEYSKLVEKITKLEMERVKIKIQLKDLNSYLKNNLKP